MAAPHIPRAALSRAPAGATIVAVERMSPAFTKYHLDDGRALHRFRLEEPDADPHDHPWSFRTEILDGGYGEEVFFIADDGSWHSELVQRDAGTSHHVAAEHIHRIVALPQRECWTLVSAAPQHRETRFWRFGEQVWSRLWNERQWRVIAAARPGMAETRLRP